MILTRHDSCVYDAFYFYRFLFLINLLELLSFHELDLFNDDSNDDGYGSGSPGMCTFTFFSGDYVGFVSGVGSGVFVPTGIKLIGDVVSLVLFVPRGFESIVGPLI